jgi:hypothetical protein
MTRLGVCARVNAARHQSAETGAVISSEGRRAVLNSFLPHGPALRASHPSHKLSRSSLLLSGQTSTWVTEVSPLTQVPNNPIVPRADQPPCPGCGTQGVGGRPCPTSSLNVLHPALYLQAQPHQDQQPAWLQIDHCCSYTWHTDDDQPRQPTVVIRRGRW